MERKFISKEKYFNEVLSWFGEGDSLTQHLNMLTFKNESGCVLSTYNLDTEEVIYY